MEVATSPSTSCARRTTRNERCLFPFTYNGLHFDDCAPLGHNEEGMKKSTELVELFFNSLVDDYLLMTTFLFGSPRSSNPSSNPSSFFFHSDTAPSSQNSTWCPTGGLTANNVYVTGTGQWGVCQVLDCDEAVVTVTQLQEGRGIPEVHTIRTFSGHTDMVQEIHLFKRVGWVSMTAPCLCC
jgi:hypothetical protein